MNKQAALNSANMAMHKFLEHQTLPTQGGMSPEDIGKKYAQIVNAFHAEAFAYFQKIQD